MPTLQERSRGKCRARQRTKFGDWFPVSRDGHRLSPCHALDHLTAVVSQFPDGDTFHPGQCITGDTLS
jgi:hypothetical protein